MSLIFCSVYGALEIKQSAVETYVAESTSQRYEHLERALWKEADLVRVHGFDHDAADWSHDIQLVHSTGTAVESTLRSIEDSGNVGDRAFARSAEVIHAEYVDVLHQLLAQIDESDPEAALTFRRSAVLADRMQAVINARATAQHSAALRALQHQSSTQDYVVRMMLLASVIAASLFVVANISMRRFRQAIERSRTDELHRLSTAALTDTLTGLGNHRSFQECIACEASRSSRHGASLTLAVLDVDCFKTVNDSKGHLHGDQVLTSIGQLLQALRTTDRGFRLGGDEFAIVMPDTTADQALVMLNRLRLEARARLDGTTVSIGLASTDGSETDALALRKHADAALYAVKRRGRNGVLPYLAEDNETNVVSAGPETSIRQLIRNGDMDVVFQPIWDLQRSHPLGYEALSRPPARYGFSGPQEAFDVAERLGLAPALDATCLNAIVKRVHEIPGEELVFINVVPDSLRSETLDAHHLRQLFADNRFPFERVVIELTERSMTHLDEVVREARRLRGFGFRIALDDTGAGHAGLAVLRQLAVDFVKIDRAVVTQATTEPVTRAILRSITSIARAMNAYVIAEGIETTDALDCACSSGQWSHTPATENAIDGAQGYLLGRANEKPWQATQPGTALLLERAELHMSC